MPSLTANLTRGETSRFTVAHLPHQAMRHSPDRVTDACRSLALAHGLEHLCPAAPPKTSKKRASKKAGKTALL